MDNSFAASLKKLLALRGHTVQEACELTNGAVKTNTLNKIIQRGSKPTFETIDELCRALDVPHSYFSQYRPSMGITAESDASHLTKKIAEVVQDAMSLAELNALKRQSQIGTDDVLDWLARTGGRLENFDALQESVDLFRVMGSEDRTPTPFRIGHESANSTEFNIKSNEQYSKLLGAFPDDFLEGIKRGHIEASHRPYMVSDVEMNGEVGGRLVKTKYRRIHAKVYLPDGEPLTMIHAVFIPNSHWSSNGSSHLDLIQRHPNHADAHQEA